MMKDTVLLMQLVGIIGGMDSILKDPSDFMSAVSFYLINHNYNAKHLIWYIDIKFCPNKTPTP